MIKKDNHYGYVIVIIFHTCLTCLCSFNFLLQIPNTQRQNRQNRGRMNGHMLPQGSHSFSYMPQSVTSSKESSNQQVFFFSKLFLSSPIHMLKMCACSMFYLMTMHFTLPQATLKFYFRFYCPTPIGILILQSN